MYKPQNFENLIGTKGFSDELLRLHFGLYEGYVKNTNLLMEKLERAEKGTPEHSEMQRHFGWEWNGMRLHELYFGNMTKEATMLSGGLLREKIEKIYGDISKWQEDFISVGKMRGIGWVILAHDKESEELFNVWVTEHDLGHLAGAVPILVMDVFEHAYARDYGTDRAAYIGAFFSAIDWMVVEKRLV